MYDFPENNTILLRKTSFFTDSSGGFYLFLRIYTNFSTFKLNCWSPQLPKAHTSACSWTRTCPCQLKQWPMMDKLLEKCLKFLSRKKTTEKILKFIPLNFLHPYVTLLRCYRLFCLQSCKCTSPGLTYNTIESNTVGRLLWTLSLLVYVTVVKYKIVCAVPNNDWLLNTGLGHQGNSFIFCTPA